VKAPTARAKAAASDKAEKAPDADHTRLDILEVATSEFAAKGLSGARIDEIAQRTHTSKRMIYYYFGSKEGLYTAVLERCYAGIREVERVPDLDVMDPAAALRTIVEVNFDHHVRNPDFVRLVMSENIAHGVHIANIQSVRTRSQMIVDTLGTLLRRGAEMGLFRKDVDAVNLHMSISALCFYNVSNRYTFSQIFEWDMTAPASVVRRRAIVVDMVMRWVAA
jgi:AcrR family transcriptional regulator